MSGNSYGGSPRAIYEYLLENYPEGEYLWAFSEQMYHKYQESDNALKLYTNKYYYNLVDAAYIISDQRLWFTMLPQKRKGQRYIQTWHGTALKKIEKDMPNLSHLYERRGIWDSRLTDFYVSGSGFMTDLFKKSFWFSNEVLEIGTPRNDIFFNTVRVKQIRSKVYKYFGLPESKKIILYAPTFRGSNSLDYYDIDFDDVIKILNKDGDDWVSMIRLHPNLVTPNNLTIIKQKFMHSIDASVYPDMQELLVATDILLTDYSSSMFDYMYSRKPCVIYATDIDSYDRGYYHEIKDILPFPIASSTALLCETLSRFDVNKYNEDIEKTLEKMGSCENGTSCKQLINYLSNNEF